MVSPRSTRTARCAGFAKHNPFPLPALTLTALFGLALACSAQAQTQAVANPRPAAPADPARPYSYVFLDPLEGQHTAPNSPSHVGVEMHGHWVIDVRNPDGTLAEHRDFENTLEGQGAEMLVALMSGYAVPSDYAIFVTPNDMLQPPCTVIDKAGIYANDAGCVIVHSLTTLPATFICNTQPCFTGLTYTTTLGGSGSFVLAGNFTASQAGTIATVALLSGTCPAPPYTGVSSQTTVSPSACNATPGTGIDIKLSSASITAVNVAVNQIVQVTVTITFS